jgi:RHS repeat-associated protein
MYTCTISLPGVAANNLCGPTWGVSVAFSPLNATDVGFGIGWSLTTTRYDGPRKRLSLSSGESFVVDTFVDNKATFKDRKLRTFDFIKVGVDGDYRIVHKSGMTELLKVLPGSDGIAALHEVRSPEGYAVMLDVTATNGVVRLRGIVDGTGRRLLDVTYERSQTVITLQPGTAQAAAFTFRLVNDRLVGIDLPEGYGDGWLFGYESTAKAEVLDLLLLKSTTVPTGGKEEVAYEMEGHQLPGPVNEPLYMPRVVMFHRYPGHGQPEMKTGYAYSNRNFFGYGELSDWMDDEDNLYRVVMPPGQRYEYSSTETQYDGDEALRTVVRTFNRFHLLTLERSTEDGCVKEVETVFDESPDVSFASQVPWCQLPAEMRTRYYYLEEDPPCVREDVECRTYDDEGNVITHADVNGAVEYRHYYHAEGVDGQCPPDPIGFKRFLREKRVSPPPSLEGAVRVSRYRYELLPSRLPGGVAHVVSSFDENLEENAAGELESLGDVTYTFVDDMGPHHGRMQGSLSVINGVPTISAFIYALPDDERHHRTRGRPSCMQINAIGDVHPSLVTSKITKGSNGEETMAVTRFSAHSLSSGTCVMDQGRNGVVTRYANDALGRLIEETTAAGSEFPATKRMSYILASKQSSVVSVDAAGQTTRVDLDGFGREVRRIAVNWVEGGEQEVWRAAFDALGRMREKTTTDSGVPLASHGKIVNAATTLSLTTSYIYDGWGNVATEARPDGVVVHHRVDPVRRVDETWEVAANAKSAATRTFSSMTSKPLTIEKLCCERKVTSSTTYVYDAFDRCTVSKHTGEGIDAKTTHYAYDPHGRLVESRLPDGSVVSRSYPAFTDEGLISRIAIRHVSLGEKDVTLGEQGFDGLGRRRSFVCGGRSTGFRYDSPASCEPDHVDLPSGQTLACEYQTHLADALIRLVSPDEVITFERDAVHGRVTRAENHLGSVRTTYFPSGNVRTESSTVTGISRGVDYTYSLLGHEVSRASRDGYARALGYDLSGRLAVLDDGNMNFVFEYDTFSRASRISSTTKDGARSMDVALEYDDFGREIERRIEARLGKRTVVRKITQAFTADDRLSSRISAGEHGVRIEAYRYDVRGRMVSYACSGSDLSLDHAGRAIREQTFSFDALDNIRQMVVRHADPVEADETYLFSYAEADPTQMVEWVRRRAGQPDQRVLFTYDASGNLEHDEEGRELIYDAMGRLSGWKRGNETCVFQYDALDRICSVDDDSGARRRFYEKDLLAYEAWDGHSVAFHRNGRHYLSETRVARGVRKSILLGADGQGSTVCELSDELRVPVYTPHGRLSSRPGVSDVAFSGEIRDRSTGWYIPASYRAYNPGLMRFHGPDAASPFGRGGLNAYVYAAGDPVNHVDPSGQSLFGWLAAGVGALMTIGLTIASWGTLAPAMSAVWSTAVSAVGGTTTAAASTASVATTAGTASAAAITSTTVASASVAQWGHALAGIGGIFSVPFDFGAAYAEEQGNEDLAGALGFVGLTLGFVGDFAAFKPAAKRVGKFLYGEAGPTAADVSGATRTFEREQWLKRTSVEAFESSTLAPKMIPQSAAKAAAKWLERTRSSKGLMSSANSERARDAVTEGNRRLRSHSEHTIEFGEDSRSPSALSNISTMNRSAYPTARTPSPEFYTPMASPEPVDDLVDSVATTAHLRRFSWP